MLHVVSYLARRGISMPLYLWPFKQGGVFIVPLLLQHRVFCDQPQFYQKKGVLWTSFRDVRTCTFKGKLTFFAIVFIFFKSTTSFRLNPRKGKKWKMNTFKWKTVYIKGEIIISISILLSKRFPIFSKTGRWKYRLFKPYLL